MGGKHQLRRNRNPNYNLKFVFGNAHGIKGSVPQDVLYHLIAGAKKHCVVCKLQLDSIGKPEEGEEHPKCVKCKLKRALETAGRIFKKLDRRNKIAFDERRARRERAEAAEREEFHAIGAPGEEPVQEWTPGEGGDRPTRW